MARLILIFALTALLSACATASRKTDLNVLEINSLSSPKPGSAQFRGLEFLADPLPGEVKNRVNIFYVHGIGWTENPDGDPLANDFIAGVAGAYGLENYTSGVESLCGENGPAREKAKGREGEFVYITPDRETRFQTALSGSHLQIDRLVCMDKHVLPVDDVIEFVVYRVFWDDLFWNALQFPHVGQDDDAGSSKAFAGLRRKYNRRFKDELVNYGFSDAVMYLGPAGTELRRAIQGAMCSAALDASGYQFAKQGHELSYGDACNLASWKTLQTNQFAFVTESLGSKIVFDVMQDSLTDGKDNIIDDMISGSEFYMLANQIALLSLNDLAAAPRPPVRQFTGKDRPKIIAMSEVNDFLTYELIPFYEQLWKRSERRVETAPGIFEAAPAGQSPDDPQARAAIMEAVGWDIIDMRLEFADRMIPLVDGLVDPLQAHGGHMSEPELVLYLLCGADAAKLKAGGCLAKETSKQ